MTIRTSLKATIVAGAALGALASAASIAMAADIIEQPQIIHAPVIEKVKPFGGWYIRGDVGYAMIDERNGVMRQPFEDKIKGGTQPAVLLDQITETDYDDAFTVGFGVGARLSQFLRADITADYVAGSDVHFGTDASCAVACGSSTTFEAGYDALLVMANAYVEAGTFAGITPYVGAGIGFAHVEYGDVIVTDVNATLGNTSTQYESESSLRLAWSLAAGASYDINDQFTVDAGYRFTRIQDDVISTIDSLEYKDDGIDLHQVRVGARVNLH